MILTAYILPRSQTNITADAIIQWETAAFYTFDAESDGQPIAFGSPDYYQQTTRMSVGITRLGSSKGKARVKWKSE